MKVQTNWLQNDLKQLISALEKDMPCPFQFIPKGRTAEDVVVYKVMRHLYRKWWRQQRMREAG